MDFLLFKKSLCVLLLKNKMLNVGQTQLLVGSRFFQICLFSLLLFGLGYGSACAQKEIKLATHNSLTYLKPQWYFRWLNFTAKCQRLTIEEQYRMGVRYFDFRIKFIRNRVRGGHGLMVYKADFDRIYTFLNEKKDCYVNIVLENFYRQGEAQEAEFVEYVQQLVKCYPHIKFVGGNKKNPWVTLVPLGNVPVKACFEFYKGKHLKFPYPLRYARKKNKKYWTEVDDKTYSMFDFIEIGTSEKE